jgi:hypothetical protein
MNLDYIDKVNEYGDNMVRLYEFDKAQAIKFRDAIQQTIIANKKLLPLTSLHFIQSRNCYLTLRISDEDEGITTTDKVNFVCDLTLEGYAQMLVLLEPFCTKETKGYKFLYDVDSQTDFLFSPGGTW